MDRRQRKSIQSSHFSKFLKPGALARLRDSKIIAKSVRSAPVMRLAAAAAQAVAQPEVGAHQLRFVSYRGSGPRYLLRKKLMASKTVYFAPPSPSTDLADPFVDIGFGSDLVAAH
ncbi:hypothetical protein LUZ60_017389 [Juncus effusus]|nr:hypothetical protein LUZ60_017389 [Juncus effusus]